jgi:hypothetical protein
MKNVSFNFFSIFHADKIKRKKLSKIRGKYSLKNGFKKDHQGQKKGGLKWDFKGSGGQR